MEEFALISYDPINFYGLLYLWWLDLTKTEEGVKKVVNIAHPQTLEGNNYAYLKKCSINPTAFCSDQN